VRLSSSLGERYPAELSGGQKQRVALGLALVGRPDLVFLDEPTASMDPSARRRTWQMIGSLRDRGVTVVLTTHFMDEAERLANRVAIINQGQLVALDAPERLRQMVQKEMRFRADQLLDPREVADALAVRPDTVQVDDDGAVLVQVAPTPELVACLASWLAARNVLLLELHTGSRSLEQAFLSILGGEEVAA
jgi:ABC-2 type transport system ATP-binding protein